MSFVAEHLVAALRERLPPTAGPDLDTYEQQARALAGDRRAELRRAYTCARWAVDVAAQPAHSAIVGAAVRAGEAVREIGQAVWAEIGADIDNVVARLFPDKVLGTLVGVEGAVPDASPLVGPEIAWVLEAVDVAAQLAEVEGWDAVPWQRLLDEVLSD